MREHCVNDEERVKEVDIKNIVLKKCLNNFKLFEKYNLDNFIHSDEI